MAALVAPYWLSLMSPRGLMTPSVCFLRGLPGGHFQKDVNTWLLKIMIDYVFFIACNVLIVLLILDSKSMSGIKLFVVIV